jgi:predicted ATPase/DNA-binding SARP family transcriptional activator
MLEVRLIGKFAIQCDGKPVTLSSRAAQSVFAYLILTAGTLHRREKLAGMFWPDTTEQKARAYLRNELWRIRKALHGKSKIEYLIADDLTVGFDQSCAYWLDVAALKNASDKATADELITAVSFYQGELLPGFYEDWVVLEREHLQAAYETKMLRLIELLESEKRWREILKWAERWIALGQRPEAAYRALMSAHTELGDKAKVTETYQRCVEALAELGLEPSEETRALAFNRTSKLNIPIPLTSFIGREKELEEIAKRLSESRFVTLTGAGGVGKTRLAIQVVAEIVNSFPDGIWFLDLAPLSDPELVPNTLTKLLGLRESGDPKLLATEMLINYFRSRTVLVIFDNCEHLIEVCAQLVHSLLTSCERVYVLATSRESLRAAGEIPYRVPSLGIPKLDTQSDINTLAEIESVRLFAERAAITSPGFTIDPWNAFTVAQICQRLDGIPLAIELAAARVNVLTVNQIHKRLDDRFKLLAGGLRTALPRHQTLHATIEWSYSLLSDQERRLFRQLAVFMGGWTLEAAEEVCSRNGIESAEILDLLSQLVNKSLVLVEKKDSHIRYRSLESIREFAQQKLAESAEAMQVQDRHLQYFLKLTETAEPYLRRTEQVKWLNHLVAEYDNLRAAIDWAIHKPSAEFALKLAGRLGPFWRMRAYWLEGARWLDRALAKIWKEKSQVEKAARAMALYRRAEIAEILDELDILKTTSESALVLCEAVEDAWGLAFSRALVAAYQRRMKLFDTTTENLLNKSVSEFEILHDAWGESWVLDSLARGLREVGRQEEFHQTIQRAITLARDSGDRERIASSLAVLSLDPIHYGKWEEAEKILKEVEQLYFEIDELDGINFVSFLRARIHFAQGNFERAKAEAKLVLEYLIRTGERNLQSETLVLIALIANAEHDLQSAVAYTQKALELGVEMKIISDMAFGCMLIGFFSYHQGNAIVGMQYARKSLVLVQSGEISDGDAVKIFDFLGGLLLEKNTHSAVQILALAESLAQSSGVYRGLVFHKPYFDHFLSTVRSKLSETEFASAWDKGSKMSLDKGVAYALRELQ